MDTDLGIQLQLDALCGFEAARNTSDPIAVEFDTV